MRHMCLNGLLTVGLLLTLNGCSVAIYSGTRRAPPPPPTTVTVDEANGMIVETPTIGEVAAGIIQANKPPEVWWLSSSGNQIREYGSQYYNFGELLLPNGGYRQHLQHVLVPNRVIRSVSVIETTTGVRIPVKIKGNNVSWKTPNRGGGGSYHYLLRMEVFNSSEVFEYEYDTVGSPSNLINVPQ